MKSKLYRVLVLLVAIAMMIPSFALAADPAPTMSLGDVKKIEKNLVKSEIGETCSDIQVTVTDVPANTQNPQIWWETSNANVAKVPYNTQLGTGTSTVPVYVEQNGVGEATITGTLHLDNKATDLKVTFPVNLKPVDVTSIKFNENAPKKITVYKNGASRSYSDYVDVVVPEGGSTYYEDKGDLRFAITKGDSIATVQNPDGFVTFSEAGTVELKAYIPGSSKSDTITIEVSAAEEQETEDVAKGYTSLEFTAQGDKVYVITNAELNLGGQDVIWIPDDQGGYYRLVERFLTKYPADADDQLFWSSSKPGIATVDQFGVVNFGTHYGEVTITVQSKVNSSVKAECTVKRVKRSEVEKSFTKLGFNPSSIKERNDKDKPVYAFSYLTVREPSDAVDSVFFTTSDSTIAMVDEDSGIVTPKKAGTVVITAHSKKDPAVVSDPALTIEFVDGAKNPYTALKFSKVDPIKKDVLNDEENPITVDLNNYLTKTAEKKDEESDDELFWKSGDKEIATVGEKTGVVTALKAGTVTIKVRNAANTVNAEVELTIVEVDDPYTSIKFVDKTPLSVKKSDGPFDLEIVTEGNEDGRHDSLIWTSSNQQIALVNKGKVTIKDAGEVTITVRSKKDEKVTASIDLKIEDTAKAIETISLTQSEFTLKAEDSLFLGRYVVTKPAIGETDDELIWTSDDLDKVSIDESGNVYCLASLNNPGKAVVTVRSKLNADVKAQFTITLEEADALKSIKFVDVPKTYKEYSAVLNLNDYVVTDPVDYKGELYWDSSDPQVAIAHDGIVEFRSQGKVTFTVSDKKGTKATCEIEMISVDPVEKIELKDITLKVGEKEFLYRFFNLTPKDTYPKDITFVSSNRDVAEVQVIDPEDDSFDGLREMRDTLGWVVVGYKAGETTITANVENYDGSVVKGRCKVTVTEAEVESVKFAAKKYTLKMNTKLSETVRFNLAPFNASNMDASDVYVMTNNTDVIDVEDPVITSKGKGYVEVYAKKPGKAWIGIKRTSDDKLLGTVKIVVESVRVKRFKLPKNAITLYWYDDGIPAANATANRTYQNYYILTPVITPSKANYTVSYETSDPSVAFVEDGRDLEGYSAKIVASGVGKCTITVKVDDGKKVRVSKLKVTVAGKTPKPVIDQKKVTLNMEKGPKSITLNVYDDNTKQALKVTWASSDKNVAKVNKDGKVTAVGAGKATITATHKDTGKTLKCVVTVKAKSSENADKVKKITGDSKVSVKVGEKKTLNIKVKPDGAKVTFKSSDTSIVKVSKDGQIKGIKAGKATITVSGDGVEFKIKVTVKK